MTIFLYGPSGSGKSSLGRTLAECLNLPFFDLDQKIEQQTGKTITDLFREQGESGFRHLEKDALLALLDGRRKVVALGGGTLLDSENRLHAERSGEVVCLTASLDQLLLRLEAESGSRPLLAGETPLRLQDLLEKRREHYASFRTQIDTGAKSLEENAWQVQVRLGEFYVRGMQAGYAVTVCRGCLETVGERLAELDLKGRVAVVADQNVTALYGDQVCASLAACGFTPELLPIQSGEQHKNLETVAALWKRFVGLGLERGSSVVALGGGVTGDLAGFAAATFLRGIPWVAVPTSLLAMVDASLGGKTGFDLPQGKNLVGAFYPPRLVLADPHTLVTLPRAELRAGMAEVLKAGIIGDPVLFDFCRRGWESIPDHMDEVIRRAMAVKVSMVQKDPFEKGMRAALNLGHTVGHALEKVSDYRISHGEAVAVGIHLEARLSEALGIAEKGLAEKISTALRCLDLPVNLPVGLSPDSVLEAMRVDKKIADGELRFALPVKIGDVQVGVRVVGENLALLKKILEEKK